MSFSLDEILNSKYLPHWLEECEIQQGTWSLSQDVILNEALGTYTNNVYGVSNRPISQLYALIKIAAKISRNHHYDSGSHHIADSDVINNSLIRESPDTNNDGINDFLGEDRKLFLDFYGMEMPDESPIKEYSTTKELADKINSLYEYLDILRKGLGFNVAFKHTIQDFLMFELGITGFKVDPISLWETSSRDAFVVTNNAELLINGQCITLRNSNNAVLNNKCIISLSNPSKENLINPTSEIVFLEVYFTPLTDSFVPLGNMQYGDNAQSITPGSTSNWLPYISNKINNIFINTSFELTQLQYKISTGVFNPSTSSYGVDQIIINNQQIVKSDIRGVWKTVNNSCLIFPLMAIANRNLGIYHFSINPGGTSVKKDGVTISSVEDCFNYLNIKYFSSSGIECPDYLLSEYSVETDLYTYLTVEYYRSGLTISLHNSNPLNYYADRVYLDDIVCIGKQLMLDNNAIVNDLTEKIFSNDLYTELNPVMKGLASSMTAGNFYSRNPVQVIGFGVSEETLFGFDNKGGIFIDKTNNEIKGTTDNVRTCWSDSAYTVPMSFSFIEGDSSSESRSFLTYEPLSQTITLNTTALSGIPLISTVVPTLVWNDGVSVVTTVWTGLGTTSAYCIITPRAGRKVYGLVNFNYRAGSGIPYILDGIIDVKNLIGESYSFCVQKNENFCLGCTWSGNPVSGDTSGLVLPTCIDCDSTTDIIDSYILILSGSNPGVYRKISQYDCDSRVILFDTPFPNAIVSTDKISIGKLEPNHTTIVINPFSRGIVGAFKRIRILTSSTNYLSTLPIISHSDGVLAGTILKNLTSATYIEVVVREDEPLTSGFYVYTKCNPVFNQYKSIPDGVLKIIKPGVLIDTTKGSASSPFSIYRQFVASYSTKTVDSTQWISTDCLTPYFKIKPLEFWDTNYDIRPTENLILDALNGILTTRKYKLGSKQSITSDISIVLPNYRLVMGITLVEILNWYYLLVTPRNIGTFGLNNGFLIDINKIY